MENVHFIVNNKLFIIIKNKRREALILKFKKYILILLIIAFFLIILFIIYNIFIKLMMFFYNKKFINKNINLILNNINKNIIICQKGILTNGILKSYSDPLITVIIIIYNSQKTIKAAIRSVQNQNFRDIEILLIDDFSKDNSMSIIKELKNEDSRIKIIKNKVNRGPLFSRSLATLNSRGKYIVLLDSDDLFVNENLFNICYQEAKSNNIDIIEFSGYESYTRLLKENGKLPSIPLYLKKKNNNNIIKQPELSYYMFSKINGKYKQIDGYLCGKLIKASIYKNSLKIITKQVYNMQFYYGEDRIINFILLKIANSFKFLEIYGFIYYYNRYSITKSFRKNKNCYDDLRFINFIYNFTKNSNESEIAVYEIFRRLNWTLKPGLNKENKNYFTDLLNLILKGKYISLTNKNKIFNLIERFNKNINNIKIFLNNK